MDDRLQRFEAMLEDIQRNYEETVAEMERLKHHGKTKTITFRQLMSVKITYETMLSRYAEYGLIER